MPARRQEMSDKRRSTDLTQHIDPHPSTTGQEVLMTEQTETRQPEFGFDFGLAGQLPGGSARCAWAAQLEMCIDSYRHNHRIATHTMELRQQGQPMLRAVDMLKQLHAKNAVDRVRRQAEGEG